MSVVRIPDDKFKDKAVLTEGLTAMGLSYIPSAGNFIAFDVAGDDVKNVKRFESSTQEIVIKRPPFAKGAWFQIPTADKQGVRQVWLFPNEDEGEGYREIVYCTYGFSKDYLQARGHYYAVEDVKKSERINKQEKLLKCLFNLVVAPAFRDRHLPVQAADRPQGL